MKDYPIIDNMRGVGGSTLDNSIVTHSPLNFYNGLNRLDLADFKCVLREDGLRIYD